MSNTALDRLVRQLREKLLTCDATNYADLWRQVVTSHKAVDALLDEILLPDQDAIAQTASDTRCDHMLADEQLPTLLASLLGRLCCRAGPSLRTLTDRQLEALSPLLWGLRFGVTRAVSILDERPAGSPAERFLVAVAAAHPCRALAGIMALPTHAAASAPASPLTPVTPSRGCGNTASFSCRLSLSATNVVLLLVSAAATSERVAAALNHDPHAAPLLARACDTTLELMDAPLEAAPEVPLCVACLASTLIPHGEHIGGAATQPGGASSSAAVRAGLLAETRVARVLLYAVVRWRWGQDHDSLGTWAAEALSAWLVAQPRNGICVAHTVQAHEVLSAVPRAGEIGAVGKGGIAEAHWAACGLLAALLASNISPAERHRAFPAIVEYAESVADLLISVAVTAAATRARGGSGGSDCRRNSGNNLHGSGGGSGGGGGGNSGSIHVLICELVVRLLNTCSGHFELELLVAGDRRHEARDGAGSTPAPAAEVRQLRVRARWCTQHRLVGKCEALLRLLCRGGEGGMALVPPRALKAAISSACHLAARTHMLLIGDERDGAPARVAHESLLATVRKIMHALPTNSNGQASAGGTAGSAAEWLPLRWMFTLGPAVLAFHDAATLLQLPPAASAAALHHVAMQLLPPAVQQAHAVIAAAATAAVHCVGHERVRVILELLACLPSLHHHCGLADVTAAAGAPMLVSSCLHNLADASSTASMAAAPSHKASLSLLTLSTLQTAIGCPAWMHAARRLALVSQAQALMDSLFFALAAPGGPLLTHVPAPVAAGVSAGARINVGMMSEVLELNRCMQALPSGPAPQASTPSWDACLLATLALPGAASCAAEGPAQASFFGCCRRRCTNLDGSSETALHLRKCGGCRLARYCSVACQRRAWRTGHRRACQVWQSRHCEALAPAVPPCDLIDRPL